MANDAFQTSLPTPSNQAHIINPIVLQNTPSTGQMIAQALPDVAKLFMTASNLADEKKAKELKAKTEAEDNNTLVGAYTANNELLNQRDLAIQLEKDVLGAGERMGKLMDNPNLTAAEREELLAFQVKVEDLKSMQDQGILNTGKFNTQRRLLADKFMVANPRMAKEINTILGGEGGATSIESSLESIKKEQFNKTMSYKYGENFTAADAAYEAGRLRTIAEHENNKILGDYSIASISGGVGVKIDYEIDTLYRQAALEIGKYQVITPETTQNINNRLEFSKRAAYDEVRKGIIQARANGEYISADQEKQMYSTVDAQFKDASAWLNDNELSKKLTYVNGLRDSMYKYQMGHKLDRANDIVRLGGEGAAISLQTFLLSSGSNTDNAVYKLSGIDTPKSMTALQNIRSTMIDAAEALGSDKPVRGFEKFHAYIGPLAMKSGTVTPEAVQNTLPAVKSQVVDAKDASAALVSFNNKQSLRNIKQDPASAAMFVNDTNVYTGMIIDEVVAAKDSNPTFELVYDRGTDTFDVTYNNRSPSRGASLDRKLSVDQRLSARINNAYNLYKNPEAYGLLMSPQDFVAQMTSTFQIGATQGAK